MSPAEQLYRIAKTLPDETILSILNLIHTLSQPKSTPTAPVPTPQKLPPGTLTGLRGIAKHLNLANTAFQNEYTDYLIEKYQ
jgi:hypothetical protein